MTRLGWEQKVMGYGSGEGFYPGWITRPLDDKTRLGTEGDGIWERGAGFYPSWITRPLDDKTRLGTEGDGIWERGAGFYAG